MLLSFRVTSRKLNLRKTSTFGSGLTKNRAQNAHIPVYAPLFRPIFRQT